MNARGPETKTFTLIPKPPSTSMAPSHIRNLPFFDFILTCLYESPPCESSDRRRNRVAVATVTTDTQATSDFPATDGSMSAIQFGVSVNDFIGSATKVRSESSPTHSASRSTPVVALGDTTQTTRETEEKEQRTRATLRLGRVRWAGTQTIAPKKESSAWRRRVIEEL